MTRIWPSDLSCIWTEGWVQARYHRQRSSLGQVRPGSKGSNLTILDFLRPFIFHKEKSVCSCTHPMLMTVTQQRSSIERRDATCVLQIAHQVKNGTVHESLLGISEHCFIFQINL
jgi:hypothetical protein